MSFRITFECEALDVVTDLFNLDYGITELLIRSIDVDEVEAIEATTPEDVLAVLGKDIADAETPHAAVQAMQRAHARLSDGVERDVITSMITDAEGRYGQDEAPAHGIPRPLILRKPGWPEGYWINTGISPTQGSGNQIRGLDQVPCRTCLAPIGEVCIAQSHGAYRKGYGHTARRSDYKNRPPV